MTGISTGLGRKSAADWTVYGTFRDLLILDADTNKHPVLDANARQHLMLDTSGASTIGCQPHDPVCGAKLLHAVIAHFPNTSRLMPFSTSALEAAG